MNLPQLLNRIYSASCEAELQLERIRDYEPGKWNAELEEEHKRFSVIWDMCRASKYFFEADLDEHGNMNFERVTSDWIREMLNQLNVSQTELAAGVNVSPQQITMWLNGTRNPSGAAQAAIWYFFADKLKN